MTTTYSPSKAIQVEEFIDMKYVDRGDTATWDLNLASGAEGKVTIELAELVPVEAKNHLVHLFAKPGTGEAKFRTGGNTGEYNVDAAPVTGGGICVMLSETRTAEALLSPDTSLEITVRGWWID